MLDNVVSAMVSSLRGDTMTIRELRKRYGFTQVAFAEYFGFSKRAVESWESDNSAAGRSCPTYLVDLIAYKLAKEFPEK